MIYSILLNSKMINHKIINTVVGNLSNMFNLVVFINFYQNFNNTKILLYGIIMNVFLYFVLYYFLKKRLVKN